MYVKTPDFFTKNGVLKNYLAEKLLMRKGEKCYLIEPQKARELLPFHTVWYNICATSSTGWNDMQKPYTNIDIPGGITKNNRQRLDLLNRSFSEPFGLTEAGNVLGMNNLKIKRLLASWASKGWVSRVTRGLYITVPLGTINPTNRQENPWIVASKVFDTFYIGGWSACEHWELTEQIFNDVVIFTLKRIRSRKIKIQNTTFFVKYFSNKSKLFGTETIWENQTKINISDPSRTIADILDNPAFGGGMKHTAEVIKNYFESKYRDDNKLLGYIARLNNNTIYKRLGYCLEKMNISIVSITDICRSKISKGYSILDPTVPKKGKFTRRWNLIINTTIS
ncbi:hypothetical protein OAR19_00510 [bacterium]|nr:hypothetical protein [bacterium]